MGIIFNIEDAMNIARADGLLMDVARRAQLPPSKHIEAIEHFDGLSVHVDRAESPLGGKVIMIYPSGSFSIHCAIYSKIRSVQHDVDVVVELDLPGDTDPAWMLDKLYDAIKGEPGSKYHSYTIEKNSRCVTVTYPDGVTVDLMPVTRIPNGPERSALLFHHKPESGEKYRKEVNPKGFTNYFNANISSSEAFAKQYWQRKMLVEGLLVEKAETQPMPDHVPIEEKSPRVLAIQLIKRFRDVQYRQEGRRSRRLKKPPSVVIAAMALDVGPMSDSLATEVKAVARHFAKAIRDADAAGLRFQVMNPAHLADEFTDRWPEDRETQRLWQRDLERLARAIDTLGNSSFDPAEANELLEELFGEALAEYAIEKHFAGQSEIAKRNKLGIGPSGSIGATVAAIASPALILPAHASTNMAGVLDDIDD